jgi:5-methylcytosine-specific restriction endonuclease McrA
MKHELLTLAMLGGVAYLATHAFSQDARRVILKRDKYRCVKCGSTDHIECAHINHNKNSPRYNDPSNGRVLCARCHLGDHMNREGHNGLKVEQNRWAVDMISRRVDR